MNTSKISTDFPFGNALFRVSEPTGESFPQVLFNLDNDPEEDYTPDLIFPLLPPQINYKKVNKHGVFNDTYSDTFFNTFYFHPSFGNILLLLGLFAFTLWVIVMNMMTAIGLWRTHRKGHITDLYLSNMAVGDTLLGILILPLMSVVILLGYFPFPRIVCDLWVFMDYYLIVTGSFGTCALMCNYLWMMRSPTTFPVDEKYHKRVIIVCWLAVNVSWTPSFINDRLTSYYPPGQCGYGVSRNRIFSFYIGMSGFCIPLAISIVCTVWSLVILKTSGIPLLSLKQIFCIGRRKRSSIVANEIIWTFLKLLPDAIIDSLNLEKKSLDGDNCPRFFGPGADEENQKVSKKERKRAPPLKHLKQTSFTKTTDPSFISQMAIDHYPLVVTSLILFIVCRSLFYVYFGVGSFVPNFLPLDLSNGVYWLMHSNAAISPLVHFAFDPELREEVASMCGIKRSMDIRSAVIEPVNDGIPTISSQISQRKVFQAGRNSEMSQSKESAVSTLSPRRLSVDVRGPNNKPVESASEQKKDDLSKVEVDGIMKLQELNNKGKSITFNEGENGIKR